MLYCAESTCYVVRNVENAETVEFLVRVLGHLPVSRQPIKPLLIDFCAHLQDTR